MSNFSTQSSISSKPSKLSTLLKSKGLKCFKGFKLCTTGNQPNSINYEVMPYLPIKTKSVDNHVENVEIRKCGVIQFVSSNKDFDDDFDNLMEMYYKAPNSNLSLNKKNNSLSNNNSHYIERNLNLIQPSHNSTQLGHQDSCCDSIYLSASEMSFKTIHQKDDQFNNPKLTSTVIQNKSSNIDLFESVSPSLSKINETRSSYDSLLQSDSSSSLCSNAYSNFFYNSPVKSTNSSSSDSSSCDSFRSSMQQSLSVNSCQFKSVTDTFFDTNKEEQLYVCCISYDAKDNSEVSLEFADRLKIIYEKEDTVLVQNITNGQCGYVPTYCIISLEKFLNDLKNLSKLNSN